MSVRARITNAIGDGSGGPSVGGGRSTDQEAEALDAGKVRGAFLQVLHSTMTYHTVDIRALALVDMVGQLKTIYSPNLDTDSSCVTSTEPV